MSESLVALAMWSRTQEQLENCPDDSPNDPEAIVGPERCSKCHTPFDEDNRSGRDRLGTLCRTCWLEERRNRKTCLVDGCGRKAKSNGRCRKHRDGDPEFWSFPAVGLVQNAK